MCICKYFYDVIFSWQRDSLELTWNGQGIQCKVTWFIFWNKNDGLESIAHLIIDGVPFAKQRNKYIAYSYVYYDKKEYQILRMPP